jgi:hypothetical protein
MEVSEMSDVLDKAMNSLVVHLEAWKNGKADINEALKDYTHAIVNEAQTPLILKITQLEREVQDFQRNIKVATLG